MCRATKQLRPKRPQSRHAPRYQHRMSWLPPLFVVRNSAVRRRHDHTRLPLRLEHALALFRPREPGAPEHNCGKVNFTCFTVFREPVDRVKSCYYFRLAMPHPARIPERSVMITFYYRFYQDFVPNLLLPTFRSNLEKTICNVGDAATTQTTFSLVPVACFIAIINIIIECSRYKKEPPLRFAFFFAICLLSILW